MAHPCCATRHPSLCSTAVQASFANALVRMKLELYKLPASQPSAVILDGYNALFHTSAFYEAEFVRSGSTEGPLRKVDAQELTLGANLRVLSDEEIGNTVVMAATCSSGSTPELPLALAPDAAPYEQARVPMMSETELGRMLLYYRCASHSDKRQRHGVPCLGAELCSVMSSISARHYACGFIAVRYSVPRNMRRHVSVRRQTSTLQRITGIAGKFACVRFVCCWAPRLRADRAFAGMCKRFQASKRSQGQAWRRHTS